MILISPGPYLFLAAFLVPLFNALAWAPPTVPQLSLLLSQNCRPS